MNDGLLHTLRKQLLRPIQKIDITSIQALIKKSGTVEQLTGSVLTKVMVVQLFWEPGISVSFRTYTSQSIPEILNDWKDQDAMRVGGALCKKLTEHAEYIHESIKKLCQQQDESHDESVRNDLYVF